MQHRSEQYRDMPAGMVKLVTVAESKEIDSADCVHNVAGPHQNMREQQETIDLDRKRAKYRLKEIQPVHINMDRFAEAKFQTRSHQRDQPDRSDNESRERDSSNHIIATNPGKNAKDSSHAGCDCEKNRCPVDLIPECFVTGNRHGVVNSAGKIHQDKHTSKEETVHSDKGVILISVMKQDVSSCQCERDTNHVSDDIQQILATTH